MAQLTGIARIGRDVEVRYTPQSDAVANISLAFNYGKKDGDGNKPTQWVDASLWGQRAEAIAPHLLKGTLVYVVLDDVHQEDYQTRDGRSGSKIVGRVNVIEFAARPQQSSQPAQQQAPQATPQQAGTPATQSPRPATSLAEMADDCPF
ncbi:single-stranded DNA-binding protein [Bordetella genomosp. 4]|uniref:Single-stranded DNA-binding protein n=1 Tax=Bordetella genomosp. 4 TaxID=463044 RepID=A0A261U7R3_9BORD|nr:single-stranded DNA-binding protein [Bordetella genomosp. 4]OZI57631.1 single-stranded DNA-binding protein [Bordetella genomosp. 4]